MLSVAISGHTRFKIEKNRGLIVEKSLDNFCHFSIFYIKSYSLSPNELNYNELVQRHRFEVFTSCDRKDTVTVVQIV